MVSSLLTLLILALPVACVAWTVTHEKVFEPVREWFQAIHEGPTDPSSPVWLKYPLRRQGWPERFLRYMAYAPTCEYCFSHYVALVALHLAPVRLLGSGVAGYVLAWFALVWIANLYMNVHFRLRLSIRESGNRSKKMEALLKGDW